MSEELSLEMAVPPTPPAASRGPVGVIVFFSLLLLVVAGSAAWLLAGRMPLSTGAVSSALHAVTVPPSAGIAEIFVQEGQRVTAGQPLARLDVAAYSRYHKEARALVRAAMTAQGQRATPQQASQLRAQEHLLVQRLAEARYAEEDARQRMEQSSILQARSVLQRREMDMYQGPDSATKRAAARQAETTATRAHQQAKAAFERTSLARSNLEREIRSMRENFTARLTTPPVADVEVASEDTGPDPIVKAPVEGIVRDVLQPRQNRPHDGSIMHIAPDAAWKVVAMLPQAAAQQLCTGQICSITLPAPMDATVWGTVVSAAPPQTSSRASVPHDALEGIPLDDGANTTPVTIVPRTGAELKPQHGTPVTVTVWRNTLPGLETLFLLLTPPAQEAPKE